MARLTRLAVAGHAHLLLLRGHGGQPVFRDDVDRAAFLSALEAAASAEQVAIHAYALLPERVWLLGTPASTPGLGRAVQVLGRRFSAGFNRRHRRSGSVWDGRYRSTVIEPGPAVLEAMVCVDQAPVRAGISSAALAARWSSARQHAGLSSEFSLTDAPAYWSLGNTPFDRCSAYRGLVEEPLGVERVASLEAAVSRGRVVASPEFLEVLQARTSRPLIARPRGRPRRQGQRS